MNAMDESMIHGRISQYPDIAREVTLHPTGYPTPSPERAKSGLHHIVQKLHAGLVSVLTEATTMQENKPPVTCPTCGGCDTVRCKGPQGLCETCYQQRHECRTCGQRFLSFWDLSSTRCYGDAPRLEVVNAR